MSVCAVMIPSKYLPILTKAYYNDNSFSVVSNSIFFQGYNNNSYVIFGYNSPQQQLNLAMLWSPWRVSAIYLYSLLQLLRNAPLMFCTQSFTLFHNLCSCVLELMKVVSLSGSATKLWICKRLDIWFKKMTNHPNKQNQTHTHTPRPTHTKKPYSN